MKEVVDSLLALIPFLQRYPAWVKVVFLVWLACSFVLVAALVFAKSAPKSLEANTQAGQQATISSSTNSPVYQAGRDIVITETRWEDKVADDLAPLTFQSAVYRGAPYPPGTRLGGIEWQDRFSDIRLDIRNRGDVDVEEIDVFVQIDQSIAGVGQLGNVPNFFASPREGMRAAWLEGQDEKGNAVSIPVVPGGIVIAPVWRLSCPKLLMGSDLHLIIAGLSLNPPIGGQLPQKLFAPRKLPTWMRIEGRYQTSTSDPPRRFQLPPKTVPLQ